MIADGAALAIGGTATLDASQPIADVLALAPAGGEAGTSALAVVEGYQLADDRWIELPRLPTGRAGTGGAAVAGRIGIPGGAHRLRYEPTADVESLAP